MRSHFRMLLVLLAVTFSFNFSSAVEQNPNPNNQVLADILSPDELAEEMGISQTPAEILAATRFADKKGRLQIFVDKSLQGTTPTAQTMEIYLDGQLIHQTLVSTGRTKKEIAKSGREYFSSTPRGTFKIYRRSIKHWSSTWKAPMPYAQFFNGGIAIHATTKDHYAALGTRDSGGCVRVTLEDAKYIWELVDQVGVNETRITVYENEQPQRPVAQVVTPVVAAPEVVIPELPVQDSAQQ